MNKIDLLPMNSDRKLTTDLLTIKQLVTIPLTLLLCAGGCAEARKKPACVIDIDRTITNAGYQRRTELCVPLLDARDALRRMEAGGIKIVYLSKRMEGKMPKTVKWLEDHGFPSGEKVIHKQDEKEYGVEFKLREIGKIEEKYDVLCGFGNLDDHEIYRRAGIKSICRDPWQNEDWPGPRWPSTGRETGSSCW